MIYLVALQGGSAPKKTPTRTSGWSPSCATCGGGLLAQSLCQGWRHRPQWPRRPFFLLQCKHCSACWWSLARSMRGLLCCQCAFLAGLGARSAWSGLLSYEKARLFPPLLPAPVGAGSAPPTGAGKARPGLLGVLAPCPLVRTICGACTDPTGRASECGALALPQAGLLRLRCGSLGVHPGR